MHSILHCLFQLRLIYDRRFADPSMPLNQLTSRHYYLGALHSSWEISIAPSLLGDCAIASVLLAQGLIDGLITSRAWTVSQAVPVGNACLRISNCMSRSHTVLPPPAVEIPHSDAI